MPKLNKALAGYHLLVMIAHSDGVFSSSEEKVIKEYLSSNPGDLENLNAARKKLKETKSDLFRSTSKLIQPNEPGFQSEDVGSSSNDGKSKPIETNLITIRPWTKIPDNWKIKTALELQSMEQTTFKFESTESSSHLLITVAPVRKGRLL